MVTGLDEEDVYNHNVEIKFEASDQNKTILDVDTSIVTLGQTDDMLTIEEIFQYYIDNQQIIKNEIARLKLDYAGYQI